MAGWLARAKSAMRRRSEPVPFAVTSSAGRVVEGVREESHQTVTCPVSRERLFVLPIDSYPQPGGTGTEKSKKSRRTRGEPASEQPTRSRRELPEATTESERPRRGRRLPSREGVRNGLRKVRERAGAWFTPMRSLLLGLLLVVVLTSWWVLRSRARSNAEIALRTETSAAWAALEAGEFEAADESFQRVVAALDTLDIDDDALRRAAAEMHVAVELSGVPLFDVLNHPEDFERQHQGEWMVFEAPVSVSKDDRGEPLVRVELPLEIDGVTVDVITAPTLFAGLTLPTEESGESLVAIFAARLGTLESTGGDFPRWTLTLDAEGGLLWSTPRTLVAVGIVPDELRPEQALQEVLDRQSATEGER